MIRIVVLRLVEVSGDTPWFDSVCGHAKKSFLNYFIIVYIADQTSVNLCIV